MKRIILIPAIAIAMSGFAQSTDNAFYRFDNAGTPKEISTLGTSPQFPFMKNLSSPKQVANAINRNGARNAEMNSLLTSIGFANGAKDVREANVSMSYLPMGTEGNMGSAHTSSQYMKLAGNGENRKGWKITSSTGEYVYFMAKCGNSFFPKVEHKTACVTAPVTLSDNMKDVTFNSSGQKLSTTTNVYVYYHRKKHGKNAVAYPIAGIHDDYPSHPLLLKSSTEVKVLPETYKVSVSAVDNSVSVCPDSTLNLATNINVEKVSQYGGFSTKDKKEYKEVSKKTYRKTERKIRKIDRKEDKVARMTGITVSKCAVASR
jgi:hypothetical protein